MPYVNIKVAGTLSKDQKEDIAESVSDTLERVAGKPKSATYIVFEEVARENWAKGGSLLD